MLRATLLAALLVAAACVSTGLKKFLGADVSEAITANGAPTKTAELPDGNKAYTWVKYKGRHECWITLTTDQGGTVQSYSYQDCPNLGAESGNGHLSRSAALRDSR